MLLIRVKGGGFIGMGHLYRSMAIAEAARGKHARAVVFIRNEDPGVSTLLSKTSFASCVLEDLSRGGDVIKGVLARHAADHDAVCLMDSKEDVSREILTLKQLGVPVLLLDNHTRARFHADVNIYPVAHFDSQSLQWNGYTGEHASGRDWVALSERFLEARSRLKPIGERRHLLVTMGGSDPNRLTLKVMDALHRFRPDVPIRVVLGFSCGFIQEVHRKNKDLGDRFMIVEHARNIEELMLDAGLAITALGTTLYELAYLGVPALVISNYREDEQGEQELERLGSALPLGFHADLPANELRAWTDFLWNNREKRTAMSAEGLGVADGRGAERVVQKAVSLIAGTGQKHNRERLTGEGHYPWK